MFLIKNFLVVGALFVSSLALGSPVRCAFDIGSGGIRVSASPTGVMGSTKVDIAIKKSVIDGEMPLETIRAITGILTPMKEACKKAGAKEFVGVATSGFRAAIKNGPAAAEKISKETGIQIRVIPPNEEGLLGFFAAKSLILNKSINRLLVWDIGGGSMEFSLGHRVNGKWNISTEATDVGAASFAEKVLTKKLGREFSNLYPLTRGELQTARAEASQVVRAISASVLQEISAQPITLMGIGGVHADLGGELGTSHVYTRNNVIRALFDHADTSLEQVKRRHPKNRFPENHISNLALLAGVLDAFKQEQVLIGSVNLADGLLQREDEWKIK